MTDQSPNGTADAGHDHDPPPHFSTAEDVYPPQPGDPRYDDHVKRRGTWLQGIEHGATNTAVVETRPTPYFDAALDRMVAADDASREPVEPTESGGAGRPPLDQRLEDAPRDRRRKIDPERGGSRSSRPASTRSGCSRSSPDSVAGAGPSS